MKDSEFLSAAAKSRLSIDPVPGEDLRTIAAGWFELSPLLAAKLKDVLEWQGPRKKRVSRRAAAGSGH